MKHIIFTSILATISIYFLVLVLTRFMGRKVLSQITFLDFVVGVIVGSVAANTMVNQKNSTVSGTTVLIALSALTILIDFFNLKSFRLRKLTDSEPIVIIENGHLLYENMKKTRLSMDTLMMMLRENSVFEISDVEFVLFETDGKLSVLKKSQKQPVTPADLCISTTYKGLTKDLIIDGVIMKENLYDAKLEENWLVDQLKGYGIFTVAEVFYAGLDTSGNLFVSRRNRTREKHGQHGIE